MQYVWRKLISTFITLLFVSLVTFIVFQIIPGDPVAFILGTEDDPVREATLRKKFGLDDSVPTRYFRWVTNVACGDFGESIGYSTSVYSLIKQHFVVTLSLTFFSLFFILLVSIPVAVILVKHHGRWYHVFFSACHQIGMAIPSFWLGILLMIFFAFTFRSLIPSYVPWEKDPYRAFYAFILPAIAIAVPQIAVVIRYLQTSVLDEMQQDYVRTAYGKGASKNRVIFVHVFRNALIPVVTIVGMIIADILAGSVIIEQVFTLPGIGTLLIEGIADRDLPLVQGVVMYIALVVVFINLVVDILYSLIDPRVSVKE